MRPLILISGLLSVVVMVTGCTGPQRTPQELRLMLEHDVATLDPALSTTTNSGRLIALLYGNLVTHDEHGSVVPDIATTWTVCDEAVSYTFDLREDTYFSHGRPLVADDVRTTIERVLDPSTASPRTWVFERLVGSEAFTNRTTDSIEGIEVLGDHRVRLTIDNPFAPFIGFLAMPAAAIVPTEVAAVRGADFGRQPCGSGPFVLERWTMGSELVFTKSPTAGHYEPLVERIVYTVLNEPFTYTTEFKTGNLDLIPLPVSEAEYFSSSERWGDHIHSLPGLNVFFIGMNTERGPCSHPKVRRAIAHAINADLIVNTTRRGMSVRAYGPIPPGLPGYDPTYRGIPHDPDKARQLLKETGFADGVEIDLLQDQRNENLEVTQVVVSSLERVGIRATIVPLEWGVQTNRINEGRFDLFYRSWLADYTDAENFFYPLFHSSQAGAGGNRPRFADPEVDELIERVQRTPELSRRIPLYQKLQRLVVEAAPYAFLFHRKERYVVQPWLKGFRIYPVFNSNRMNRLSLDSSLLAE